jgi:hypothetical protein
VTSSNTTRLCPMKNPPVALSLEFMHFGDALGGLRTPLVGVIKDKHAVGDARRRMIRVLIGKSNAHGIFE